jgi:hypothetical protein
MGGTASRGIWSTSSRYASTGCFAAADSAVSRWALSGIASRDAPPTSKSSSLWVNQAAARAFNSAVEISRSSLVPSALSNSAEVTMLPVTY